MYKVAANTFLTDRMLRNLAAFAMLISLLSILQNSFADPPPVTAEIQAKIDEGVAARKKGQTAIDAAKKVTDDAAAMIAKAKELKQLAENSIAEITRFKKLPDDEPSLRVAIEKLDRKSVV